MSFLLGQISCLIFCSKKISSLSSSFFCQTQRRLVCSRRSSSSRSFSMLSLMAALIFSQCFLRANFLSWQIPLIPYVVKPSLFSLASNSLNSSCSFVMFFNRLSNSASRWRLFDLFSQNSATLGVMVSWRSFSLSFLQWKSLQNFCSLSQILTTSRPLLMTPMAQVEQRSLQSLSTRQVACLGHAAHFASLATQLTGCKLQVLMMGLTGIADILCPLPTFPTLGRSLSGEG